MDVRLHTAWRYTLDGHTVTRLGPGVHDLPDAIAAKAIRAGVAEPVAPPELAAAAPPRRRRK